MTWVYGPPMSYRNIALCLSAATAAAWIVGCPAAVPGTQSPAATRTVGTNVSSADPGASPSASVADHLVAVRARGSLHGEPVRIPAAGKTPERWLVFLGTPDVATSAWYVTPGDPKNELAPVDRWPAGARVVGSVVRDGRAFVLLESVALLDQPAGLRGVWVDGNGDPFAGVRELPELERRVDALQSAPATPSADAADRIAALRAAGQSDAALARALAGDGAELVEVWQSTFLRGTGRVDASSLSASPRAQELVRIVRDAAEDDRCHGEVCETEMPAGTAKVVLAAQGGHYVIRAFRIDALPPPSVFGTPRAVAASATTTSTEQVLTSQVRTAREIVGEAPLYPSGKSDLATLGVAVTDRECNGPAVVLHDGPFARVFPLSSLCMVAARLSPPRLEARFADVDGDGRTDAIVRLSGRDAADASSDTSLIQVFLAPGATVQADEMTADHATELALLSVPTIDDAVKAVLAVPTHGTTTKDACRVLAGTSSLPAFRRASSTDVRVLFFDEPSMPTYRARVVPERNLVPDDVKLSGKECGDLECNPSRPVCASDDDDAFYWFTWMGGQLRLAGAAFYSGS
jgi:hypothetical protein